MIYFDRKTLAILRCIDRRGDRGVTWGFLRQRFGDDSAGPFSLEALSVELYTVTKNENGEWVRFDKDWDGHSSCEFCSYSTPKGRELLERRCFDFWKWVVPTLISVAALVISCIGLLC